MSNPPRAQRLRLPREFAQVLGRGRRHRGRICTIVALPHDDASPRLGLAISKKAAPNAVRRNRIKRLTRASFLRAHPASGWYVVMARPGAGQRNDHDIVADLDQLWRTLKPPSDD